MEASYSAFDIEESAARIRETLSGRDAEYTENDSVPSRGELTFNNGFYVSVTALFVDMRGSSELAKNYKRPTVAKIYRAYVSEIVAVLRDEQNVKEVSIEGDCIWAIYDTSTKADVQHVFSRASWTGSVIMLLNYELQRIGIDPIHVGIGIADGRALMIKAGHKGAAVNEVIWTGSVVAEAAKLCSFANKTASDKGLMLSDLVYRSLTEHQKSLLGWNATREAWQGNTISTKADKWFAAYTARTG